jgi:hypothetical protein
MIKAIMYIQSCHHLLQEIMTDSYAKMTKEQVVEKLQQAELYIKKVEQQVKDERKNRIATE